MSGLLNNQNQQQYYSGGDFGGYQFISLLDIIDNFSATYVGENKLLQKTLRSDISFHAHRALQELSFDTLKSCKSQEIEIPASLIMLLPQDYVNYVKLTWSDNAGIEHIIYPAIKSSNPRPILQNSDGDYALTAVGTLSNGSDSVTLDAEYKDIWVGMKVISPSIPGDSTVTATSTTGGVTTITISAGATYTGNETLTFLATAYGYSGKLLEQSTSVVLTGLSWTGGDRKITTASSDDASSLSVGMVISHEDFALGTKIIDITGAVVTASNEAINTGSSENANFVVYDKTSDTWSNYKSVSPSENNNDDDYEDSTYWPVNSKRYGLNPQHAQINGSYYIDCNEGKIHFSSNLSGKTVILKYISDGVGTDEEMMVHKFAEEAMYKWIAYGCMSARIDIPEHIIRRFKREKFAETRKAKLRLSNIKLEEITQILRGKSKQIKH